MKNFFLLSLLMITQVLGDIWLSRGMKEFGIFNPTDLSAILHIIAFLLTNTWIWLGVFFLVGSFVLYLAAISYLDLSYVLPIQAFSYVLNALFAVILLGEQVPLMRWVGIGTISGGVLLVGLTKGKSTTTTKSSLPVKEHLIPAFLLPLGLTVSKTWLAIFILSFADASGDVLMAVGMKQMGQVSANSIQQVGQLIIKVLTNKNILGGICGQSIAFITLITALSWADISLVRPASALTYVISMLGAKFILKEKFGQGRLAGIFLITLGVFCLAD